MESRLLVPPNVRLPTCPPFPAATTCVLPVPDHVPPPDGDRPLSVAPGDDASKVSTGPVVVHGITTV